MFVRLDQFPARWNNYKSDSRKQSRWFLHATTSVDHFCIPGHARFLDDISITFIDKTDPSDPIKREGYWRRTLKSMAPFGLIIEKSI